MPKLQQCLVKDKDLWIKKYSHSFYETSLFSAKHLSYVSSWKISVMTLAASLFFFIHSRLAGSNHWGKKLSKYLWKMEPSACQMPSQSSWRHSESAHCAGFLKKVFILIPNALADCGAPWINPAPCISCWLLSIFFPLLWAQILEIS